MQDRQAEASPNEEKPQEQQGQVSSPSSEFAKNRVLIGTFFENQKSLKQLQHLIREFYHVQNIFHGKMHKLVMAFHDNSDELSEEQQERLEKLLHPYGRLIANPFAEQPTGDLLMDMQHILSVINATNEHFIRILPAMMMAAVNQLEFNAFLQHLQENDELKKKLLISIHESSWLMMEGYVDMPRQNLMRYQLLLEQIRKTLVEGGCNPVEPLLMKVMEVITYIMPELKYIDEHRPTLQLMSEIDDVVLELTKLDALQGCVTTEDITHSLTFSGKAEAVRTYIDAAMIHISRGKADILETLQGLMHLLEELQQGVMETLVYERNNYSYMTQGYHLLVGVSATLFGENVIFAQPEQDPREILPEKIKQLRDYMLKLEAARIGFSYLQERNLSVGNKL